MENDKLVRLSDVVDELNEWYDLYPDSDTAREALSLAKKSIRKLQAVDAVEVRHGRWIDTEDGGYCSECACDMPMYREDWTEWEYCKTPYCPHCGARMGQRREDGDA